jgi:putative FmdB family regulatory protein
MPTYDYKCTECNNVFEETHGINNTVESCPECGGKVRRVFHPVGIIFKGAGFYKTDSRDSPDNGGKKISPKKVEEEIAKINDKSPSGKEEPSRKKNAGSSS